MSHDTTLQCKVMDIIIIIALLFMWAFLTNE
jgi:hypothetical protein